MRRPVTDVALLAYIGKKNASVLSYTEAAKACRSSSSASRALHQLIREGLIEPKPKLLGLRYVTQYFITPKGKQAASLALQLSELREVAAKVERDESPSIKLPNIDGNKGRKRKSATESKVE
jgi:DNA-binding MarR family transcriptional regulator